MKFRIRNAFDENDTVGTAFWRVTPFDYNKFMDGRLVEFHTEEELYDFLDEANRTINVVEGGWYWVEKRVTINQETHELEIKISMETSA